MFVDVYRATNKRQEQSKLTRRGWSAPTTDLDKDYGMWTHDPHLAGQTGLSRYYDFGEGPPAEAVQDESGFYRKVAQYFFLHPAQADDYVVETNAWRTTVHPAGRGLAIFSSGVRRAAHYGPRGVRKGKAVQTERGLLQRRPLDARIRLRREFSLRALRCGHPSLRARLFEQPAL